MDLYMEFEKWIDDILENNDMPEETAAYCFNLYEESVEDSVYGVQLIAADTFDEGDGDWACEECWSSEENIFCVELSDEENKDWKAALKLISGWAKEYLAHGKNADILTAKPIGIGFVDGDLELLHKV